MAIRCLGSVTPTVSRVHLGVKDIPIPAYLQLGTKRYVPLTEGNEIAQSPNMCEVALEDAKEKPRRVGELTTSPSLLVKPAVNPSLTNRLWLYDGKLYQTLRNDYTQQQVRLLILNLIEREKGKFQQLERRFKRK